MYSTSALRFAKERMELPQKEAEMVVLTGPGLPENYLIHQIEPMVAILKEKAVRIMYTETAGSANYAVAFENGKMGYAHLLGNGDFGATVRYADGDVAGYAAATEMFDRLIAGMLQFFATGEVQVEDQETIVIAEILEAAKTAEQKPGEWVAIQ